MKKLIEFKPIGVIHTPFRTKEECPIQFSFAAKIMGSVDVLEEYTEGLLDIEGFSHLYLIYLFDRAGRVEMVRHTFLDDNPHGIYASRHPCRPNSIGLSIVELIERRDNVLKIKGVDMLDETPLLDIKPYIPRFDSIESASEGWVKDREWRPKPEGRE